MNTVNQFVLGITLQALQVMTFAYANISESLIDVF
jgi:hypothetical protein